MNLEDFANLSPPVTPKSTRKFDYGFTHHALPYTYFDFETPVDSKHNLATMSLRRYLAWVMERKEKVAVAWCTGDNDVLFERYPFTSEFYEAMQNNISVSHN